MTYPNCTGLYDGQDEPEFGPACACGDKRPDGHPEFATVRVYRKGVSRPIAATAYWHEYKPEPGREGRGDQMWTRMPRVMLAKVAEALALRKAFPYDPENRQGIGADLYTADEMAQADRQHGAAPATGPQQTQQQPQSARDRVAARRATIRPEAPVTAPGQPETVEAVAVELAGPELGQQLAEACARAGYSLASVLHSKGWASFQDAPKAEVEEALAVMASKAAAEAPAPAEGALTQADLDPLDF